MIHSNRRSFIMQALVVAASILFLAYPCDATIILVRLSDKDIYVGSDGRVTLRQDDGTETYETGCKIRDFGKVTVAHAGRIFASYAGFDVWKLLESVKEESVTAFADSAERLLTKELAKSYPPGKQVIGDFSGDIAFAGFDKDGKPEFVRLMLFYSLGEVKAQPRIDYRKLIAEVDPKNNPGNAGTILMAKLGNPPEDYKACNGTDPVKEMRCEIFAYIKSDPNHINEPISIRKLTPDGSVWIERGACQ